jgi:hypothetical protein
VLAAIEFSGNMKMAHREREIEGDTLSRCDTASHLSAIFGREGVVAVTQRSIKRKREATFESPKRLKGSFAAK